MTGSRTPWPDILGLGFRVSSGLWFVWFRIQDCRAFRVPSFQRNGTRFGFQGLRLQASCSCVSVHA